MIDKTIEYRNVIMRCDRIEKSAYVGLHNNYCVEKYSDGMENVWTHIQKSVGEFADDTDEEVQSYFVNRYDNEKLRNRCIFLKNLHTGKYIGTCIAWEEKCDEKTVPVLHWLAVSDEYTGNGIARMIITQIMKIFEVQGNYPIYLHTQPWSYKAIKLYNDFGFNVCKKDRFCDAENEFELAMPVLKQIMNEEAYIRLLESSIE